MTHGGATPDPGAPSVFVVAHRGASGVVGEDQTLRAFLRAIDLGCAFVETDLRRTRDGDLVCFHDPSTGKIPVANLSREELCEACGYAVPTLAEAVEACEGRIAMDLELKEAGYEEEILRTATACPTLRAVFKSFDPSVVRALKRAAPDATVGWLVGRATGESPAAGELLDRAVALGADFLSPHRAWEESTLFEEAQARGLPVWVWTVDDPAVMRRLLARPVAAWITNRPDLAIEVLRAPYRSHTAADVRARSRAPGLGGFPSFLARSDVDGNRVHTRQVRIGPGVLAELPAWSEAFFGADARVCVVMDAATRGAAGERALGLLPKARAVELAPLEGWARVTPHTACVETVAAHAGACDALVAVGSGTINDIVKRAASNAGKPYIAVPTAASMNGYTSAIAALVVNGLKVTQPAQPPVLVLGDTEVLASAPADMARSGYADLLGKSVATADWKMASLVGTEVFLPLPGDLVDGAIERCVARAPRIGAGDPAGLEALFPALVLSGFAMTIAGSSAPASGGEHLISHLWDMRAYGSGRLPALHGLQVGIGALMTAGLYEFLRGADPAGFAPGPDDEEEQRRAHDALWPAVEAEARRQRLSPGDAQRRVERIRACWEDLWLALDGLLLPFDALRERLAAAGAPIRPEEIGITSEQARHAFLRAADIRARYTVLHLARDVGLLHDGVDRVLARMDAPSRGVCAAPPRTEAP